MRLARLIMAFSVASLVTAAAALAVAPISITQTGGLHFVGTPDVTPTKSSTEAFLTGTGEVAGAGTSATATLSADVDVTRGCINKGSKDQQPSGLKRSFQSTSGTTTFRTRSGRGTFTVETDPHITAAPFTCPDGMTPVLVSVTFTDVTLTITSGGKTLTASFGDIDP